MAPWDEFGGARTARGDCARILAEMPEEWADLAVTDPPYGIAYRGRRAAFRRQITGDADLGAMARGLSGIWRALKKDSAAFVFCSQTNQDAVVAIARRRGFAVKNRIVWDKGRHTGGDLRGSFGRRYEVLLLLAKGRPMLRGKRHDDIWRFPAVPNRAMVHQNEKPVPLLERAVESFSDEGGIVLDPFMGSGSTGVACARKRRRFVGIEISDEYYEAANRRVFEAYANAG